MKLPFNIDLKDKVCVVTGGTGILCGAMADAIAECGAKVAILALGQEACDNKAKEINEKCGQAIGIEANVLAGKPRSGLSYPADRCRWRLCLYIFGRSPPWLLEPFR